MGSPSKLKGSNFERELVNTAKAFGLHAVRAYGSNGKALGEAETVDLKIEGVNVQAKRRKALASFLRIPEGCTAVVFREDRGDTLTLIDFEFFLQLLHERDYGRLPRRVKHEQNLERQEEVGKETAEQAIG